MNLPQPGTVLAGRYLLEREVGAGGMAIVYLARDLQGIDSPRVIVVENWATEVRRLLADAPAGR